MAFLDILIGLLLIYGLYKGIRNGLFVEIASLVALIAGFFGAIYFSYITGDYLADRLSWDERYINLTAFILTFIIIVVVVNMAGKLLTKIADFAMLGLLNKIAGGIFGALKVAVILGTLLVFLDRMNTSLNFVERDTVRESVLYEPIKEIGELIFSKVLQRDEEVSEEL